VRWRETAVTRLGLHLNIHDVVIRAFWFQQVTTHPIKHYNYLFLLILHQPLVSSRINLYNAHVCNCVCKQSGYRGQ
jgi:hypothetical protein